MVRHTGEQPPKGVAREILRSGRTVQIDRTVDSLGDDSVIVRVGQADIWVTETLRVRSFPLFGKPLARRIREAIIKLDRPIEETGPDAVEQAVDAALFHGGPTEESATSIRREPPLISRDLPPPPPPPRREEVRVREARTLPDRGPVVQRPPAGPPPDDPPSE